MNSGVLRPLIYSNIYAVLAVSSLSVSTFWLIPTLGWDLSFVVLSACGTQAYYFVHRWMKERRGLYRANKEKIEWVNQHRLVLLGLTSIATLAILILLFIHPDYMLWFIPVALISLAYTLPFFPGNLQRLSLRNVPYIKPVVVSFAVVYCSTAIPILHQGIEWTTGILTLLLERIILITALTVPFDLRDMDEDRNEGLVTTATAWSEVKVQGLCIALMAIWSAVHLLDGFQSLNWSLFDVSTTALLLFTYSALILLKAYRTDPWTSFYFEGLIILYAFHYGYGHYA